MTISSLITKKARNLRASIQELQDIFETSAGHDHDGTNSKSITASVTYGLVGAMAAAGTAAANTVGVAASASRTDHVHALGTHTHASATTGAQIGPTAFAANIFTNDAAGRAPFTDAIWTAAKLAVGVLSADVTGRALFAAGVLDVTTFQSAVSGAFLSANATGRAFIAAGLFDATTAESAFADNAIPSDKVNWSFALPTTIAPDDAAAIGASTGPANASHVHAVTCAAPSGGLGAADAEGAATTFARSNHVHKATVTDAVDFSFGASDDVLLRWSTGDASNHAFVIALGASLDVHITGAADVATDWNVTGHTDPTLSIHSATTPATDYVSISVSGTTATIAAVGNTLDLTAVGSVTVNEASADVDFRVETNGLAYAVYADGGKDVLVLGSNTDTSAADKLITVSRAARTITAATDYADLYLAPAATVTTPGGASTHGVVATAYILEPNITVTGGDTVTIGACLYVGAAPTEGGTNASVYTVGAVNAASITSRGAITVNDQQISLSTGNITFSGAGYISIGASPASAGSIRIPNNTYGVLARNFAGGADINMWKVNASDLIEAGVSLAALTLAGTVTMADAINIVLNATTGTKIGTATNQKLGFYNATPVVQRPAYSQTYVTADKTHADPTGAVVAGTVEVGGTGAAEGAWDTAAHRHTTITTISEIKTSVNNLVADMADVKQVVNAIIDDLQALGLVA